MATISSGTLPLSAKDMQLVQQAPALLAAGYNIEESYQKRIVAIESLTQIAEFGTCFDRAAHE